MAQKIIVALGLEIRDYQGLNLLRYLNANANPGPNSTWTYPKGAKAKPKFLVQVVYTENEFAAALDTPGAYVVYEGHSRYGQGPAFGPPATPHVPDKKAFPVNPWGVHFRMGYDAIFTESLCDLVEHSVTPAEYDLTKVPKNAFLPPELVDAASKVKRVNRKMKEGKVRGGNHLCRVDGAWRTFRLCQPALDATKTARGDEPLKGRHFYEQKPNKCKSQRVDYLTAVVGGSADLDQVSLKCAVLFMASCSARVYYLDALRRRRKAAKSSCVLFLTTKVPRTNHAVNFLTLVFNGLNPTNRPGAIAIVDALKNVPKSGRVRVY